MFYLKVDFAKKLKCKYSIFAQFTYNSNYVNICKSMPIRAFDFDTKIWEFDYEQCYGLLLETLINNNIPYNKYDFENSIEELRKKVSELESITKQTTVIDTSILNDVIFKLEPREYQKEGIAYGLTHDCFLLADEQGLGKSMQCLNIASIKRGGNHCLIIVGYDSLQFNWAKEVEKFTNEGCYVIGQREIKSGKRKGRLRKGNMKERIEDLQNINKIKEFFLVTSVSTLRHNEKSIYVDRKTGKEKKLPHFIVANIIEQASQQGEIGRVIFDEGQVVKNITTLQTQALLLIQSPKYKIIATGTPIMNKHSDLYPILKWLGYEHRNYFAFRDEYCIMGGYKNKQIVGNKNPQKLNAFLSHIMLRRKKSDVANLPPKIIIDEYLDMDLKQENTYNTEKRKAKYEMKKIKGNKMAILAMMTKLRQVSCTPEWLGLPGDSVKFERVKQLIEEITENEQKALIFSNWATPIKMLKDELAVYNPAMIIGDTQDRMAEVDRFQNDSNCKILLGTLGAMGTGLTLTAATNVIFIDEPWNRGLKDQATDRAHRIGTTSSINVYTLICRNTFDEYVHKKVLSKGKLADITIDGLSEEEIMEYLED